MQACSNGNSMVSVTHGRPAMISERPAMAVPLPSTSMPSFNAESAAKSGAEHASFFVESVRLYEIIHETMIAFYGGSGGRPKRIDSHASDHHDSLDSEDEDLDRIVQLDRSLSRWEARLPEHLKWGYLDRNKHEISRRQTVILRIR